jgi:hypothetical protein
MRIGIIHIALMVSPLFLTDLHAQLSPGALTRAHEALEGIGNCTQCHTLGKKVSNDKCLVCHSEIKNRIDIGTGYHASQEVKGKDCAACHSEHHGRNFDMVRFDEANFNHGLTGYELTGAHRRIDCRQCHIPDFIDEPDLKKRKDTFLGLSRDCAACHQDYHQKTLSSNCASCHTTQAFAPASKFNHDRTNFALLGKHTEVACIECHRKETRNGREFQVFAEVAFANCNSCHQDPHRNNLGPNCKQCHTEQSFSSRNLLNRFNHNQTDFPLKGAHRRINCAECHNMAAAPAAIFQDRLGVHNCISCHEDTHLGKFGNNCAECHNENSFREVNMDNFNHGLTNFALLGKHQAVDCRRCHTASFTEPLPHNTCAACHVDYHEGQFTSIHPDRDCAECHSEDGFDVTLFTFEDHNDSNFPLTGAHVATPCFACHLQEEKWSFRDIGIRCVDCHEDVHAGYIDEKYYPGKSCQYCHATTSWVENHFDHSSTAFELSGAHAEQECMACHVSEDNTHRYAGFAGLSPACASCHENVHRRQFERNGVTDCARCHGFDNWWIGDFDHDKTAFKLEGRHAEIACSACHKPIEVDGEIFTQYKFDRFECIDCHQ